MISVILINPCGIKDINSNFLNNKSRLRRDLCGEYRSRTGDLLHAMQAL